MRTLIFIVTTAGILLSLDLYAYQAIRVVISELGTTGRRAAFIGYWGFSALIFITFFMGFFLRDNIPAPIGTLWFSVFMLVFVAKLILVFFMAIDDIGRVIQWVSSKFGEPSTTAGKGGISRAKFLSQVGLVVAGIPFLAGLYGMVMNAYNYQIHRVKVKLPNLPESFNGLKIVQISDIHSGSFTMKDPVMKGVEMINAEEPDIVFFTGDIVNREYPELEDYVDIFSKIKAREGVYSIFGNHDYGGYGRNEGDSTAVHRQHLIDMQKQMGWDLLLNEHRILQRGEDRLAIIGVENWGASRHFPKVGDVDKAREGLGDVAVKLLLSHDPSHWNAKVTNEHPDIDITFAGHTHGGQFGIEWAGFKWSPAQYAYKQWAGLYEQAGQYLYVNRGFGFLGFHGRVGILPEITVMELERG